jgi:cation diffusion facilitator family transporter
MTDNAHLKQTAALGSIGASIAVTLIKFAAGLISGSLALLSEAAHGLIDVGATILTYFAIREADKPADDTHHYGHAKIEAVAALAQTGVLFVLGIGVLVEAVRRLNGPAHAVEAGPAIFAVLLVSIIIDFVRWRSLSRIAKATKSDALAADALHFSSDLVSSLLVLAGLGATRLGFAQGDSVAAIGVAFFIAVAGWRLGRRTIDTLIDRAPEGLAQRLRSGALNVGGVAAIESIRLRPTGGRVQGELSIAVPRTLSFESVAAIKEQVAAAIQREAPEADVTVTANPRALSDETVLERVLLIAAMRRLAVHHVTVQDVEGVKSISLDLEVDGTMPHGEAHELASSLEAAIRAELGAAIEVETHIEPLEVRELAGHDAGIEGAREIAAALDRHAREGARLRDVHNVRVRRTDAGLVVNYHCRTDPARSVGDVHLDVDELERKMKADFPGIARIVGHAEPVRR